jgi:uncharacterized protein
MAEESLLDFPCDFPIKVMGRMAPGFAEEIVCVVKKFAPDFDESTIEMRPSRKRSYLSLTCVIPATSREQLDGLYKELCDHPQVVMVL